jgi:hypothetical protein
VNSPNIPFTDPIWDSLKIPIMVIAALAPIVIVLLIVRFRRILKKLKSKHLKDQKIFEKRAEIYERLGPKLHDLYCFYCYNGNWKEITPMYIMELKKELDKNIHSSASLFSDEITEKYTRFVQLCFVAHSGWEHEEKIKSHYELRREHIPEWREEWMYYFDPNNVVDAIKLKERYEELNASFQKDLSPLQG